MQTQISSQVRVVTVCCSDNYFVNQRPVTNLISYLRLSADIYILFRFLFRKWPQLKYQDGFSPQKDEYFTLLCLLGNSACFFVVSRIFFMSFNLFLMNKYHLKNSLDPDQTQHLHVGSDNIGSELYAKVINRNQKTPLAVKELRSKI